MTHKTLTIPTHGPGLTDITARVADVLPGGDGVVTLFIRHTHPPAC